MSACNNCIASFPGFTAPGKGANFHEFRGFEAICAKFGGVHPWRGKSEQSVSVFSAKIVFFINSRKFSPSKVSAIRYSLVFMIQWLTGPAEKIDA